MIVTDELSIEQQAALRVWARKQEAERPAPRFLDFLDHCYIQPDMDREDYDPEIEFSPKGGVKWQAWPYLIERALSWEARRSESIVKSRQLGISWLAAAYALWRGMYHQYHHVAIFSVGQREARVQLARSRFIWENLPREYQRTVKFKTDEAECGSGSVLVAFPSTEHTGISYTFRTVIRDEAGFHPYAAENYAAVRPTLSAGGQFLDMSTANPRLGPSGHFHDLYWASKRGETGYSAVFIPWNARPGRDAAWREREQRAFVGLPDEFDAYYPETDAAAFVARTGLVYPMFSEQRHVKPAPFTLASAKRVVVGVDPGGGDPTAALVLGFDGYRIHQFAEYYRTGTDGADAANIGGFIFEHRRPDTVLVDPSQTSLIGTLQGQAFGLNAVPADNRRGDGMGLVAFLLTNDRLTIEPDCISSIAEFAGYRWTTRVDPNDRTRYNTKTPVDNHADAHDARRYACAELLAMLMPQPQLPTRTLGGRRMARSAV